MKRRTRQWSYQQGKMKFHWGKVRVEVTVDFYWLRRSHWLGKKTTFLPPFGVIKQSMDCKLQLLLLESVTELTVGAIADTFLFELPLQDFPTPILVGISFINFHRTKLALSKTIHLIFSLITCKREAYVRIPFRYKFWCWGALHDTFYGYHGQVHRSCLKNSAAYQDRQFSSGNNNKGEAS